MRQFSIRERRDNNIIQNLLTMVDDVVFNKKKSNNRYRLAAAIVKKNKLLGSGVNNYNKTHPLQAKYSKHVKAIYPCAEISAITNAKRRHGEVALKGATIYIARAKWSSSDKIDITQGSARPCVGCQRHIRELGISRIVYTNDLNGFTCEEV